MISISAVIPTYNGIAYLTEALRSALAQTYELLEIIVVDDGSQEDIEKIVSPFYPKVRYVRQQNAGPAAARNRGVSLAQGEVIAFLDDDDVWHPTKTAEQVKVLEAYPDCALVYSLPELIDETGRKTSPYQLPSEHPSGSVYLDFVKRNRISTPSVTLIRREVFEKAGYFDENREYFCGEDYDLWLRIARHYEIRFCPGILVSYRVRTSGISHNTDNALKGDLYTLDKLISRHRRHPKVSDREFYPAFDCNLYHTFRRFAYWYYFSYENRDMARKLMLAAFNRSAYYTDPKDRAAQRNPAVAFALRRPYYFKDVLYLMVFFMPGAAFQLLRNAKRRLAALLSGVGGRSADNA
ncbi:glycosyltransferase family A protein [Geobacter sp. SVR]|uniref:glycosyltransferase family A protein n=1 Tax=Geobacter sp. SVR TaxID=2495594 RepID=UPI00143F0356|nr:glycosyltransferase family A protein [Geobacter sp. SVR]BCS54967.1 hypothetical protein GSVR_32750 [Geobacter sp. SVR]GCF86166.1 hypothetical protein GSbR_27660 [Geobacter sp. SVR]